jgi:hypothetical protein
MGEWWNSLGTLNQWFYGAALFFSVIFVWQFISSLIGLTGGETDVEVDTDIDAEGVDLDDIEAHSLEEATETGAAFRVLSIRAILAFCTLFTWAASLYLNTGKNLSTALMYAIIWGFAGWTIVVVLMSWLRRLTESGTQKIATCVGKRGSVYLNIPPDGQGEIRVLVSGRVTMLKARSGEGEEISAGTPIRVVRALDTTTVEVEEVTDETPQPQEPERKETEQ